MGCVRLTVEGVARDIIAQSINTGSDVSGNQFDLQVGDGGAGLFNACAGGTSPGKNSMFSGSKDAWGHQYGGVGNQSLLVPRCEMGHETVSPRGRGCGLPLPLRTTNTTVAMFAVKVVVLHAVPNAVVQLPLRLDETLQFRCFGWGVVPH